MIKGSLFFQICGYNDITFKKLTTHNYCRSPYYVGGVIRRCPVSKREVPWSYNSTREYKPPYYTADVVLQHPSWADPELGPNWKGPKHWNQCTRTYNRQCGLHIYDVKDGYPLNPVGRTGIRGRGLLGRWGPNHAVNIILARWIRDANGSKVLHKQMQLPKFELIVVKRDDKIYGGFHTWATPGRFLRNDEIYNQAASHCIIEETLNNLTHMTVDKEVFKKNLTRFLIDECVTMYRGYLDDPRNTDNAWVSTFAFLCMDETGDFTSQFVLSPGPRVLKVCWTEASSLMYQIIWANHLHFLDAASEYLNATFRTDYPDSVELFKNDSSMDKVLDERFDSKEYARLNQLPDESHLIADKHPEDISSFSYEDDTPSLNISTTIPTTRRPTPKIPWIEDEVFENLTVKSYPSISSYDTSSISFHSSRCNESSPFGSLLRNLDESSNSSESSWA